MDVLLILAIYLLIVNLAGFAAMGIDKNRARRKAWRIPESTLFLLAIIGGSIGSIAASRAAAQRSREKIAEYPTQLVAVYALNSEITRL